MNPAQTQSLITLAFAVFIVLRFALRELRPRTIGARTLWLRPGLLVAVTAWMVYLSLTLEPSGDAFMAAALAIGIALGALVGWAVARGTTFAPAAAPNAVIAQGSRVTFAIWVGAIALRLLARFLIPTGGDPRAQLPLNAGTLGMVSAAFVVIAVAFAAEIRKHAAPAV